MPATLRRVVGVFIITSSHLCGVAAGGTSFLRSGQVSEGDVQNFLNSELAGAETNARIAKLEDTLRATYKSLPKNAAGHLGHQAVRYILHRQFVQKNGWYIKGLEPNNDTWHSEQSPDTLKEWVPTYLQNLLEHRLGERGTNLRELAALAASLEDLVQKEAIGRLETAYKLHELSPSSDIDMMQAEDVIGTFYVMYLLAGNFSADSLEDAQIRKAHFAQRYTGWNEANEWLTKLKAKHFDRNGQAKFNFSAITDIVAEIGQKYYTFNDIECRDLKTTLADMEGKKPGRVRLPTFYKKGLYSHWRFTEKVDYLRTLGALDDSDPNNMMVIVPNYMMSRPNCLESSNLYAICCRNECEDLMGHLESELGSSHAHPDHISQLVANLASDTVPAPRQLSASLLGRLGQVAAGHGGLVPMHGRLFAQWMHHAYPHECPYPHEAGVSSPQTPDEWMQSTGEDDSQASEEELLRTVEADTCASTDPTGKGCGEEGENAAELPWSENEELLLHPSPTFGKVGAKAKVGRIGGKLDAWLAGIMAIALAGFLVYDYWCALSRRSSRTSAFLGEEKHSAAGVGSFSTLRVALSLCVLVLVAYAADFVDRAAFGCALCGGLLVLLLYRVVAHAQQTKSADDVDATSKKCFV